MEEQKKEDIPIYSTNFTMPGFVSSDIPYPPTIVEKKKSQKNDEKIYDHTYSEWEKNNKSTKTNQLPLNDVLKKHKVDISYIFSIQTENNIDKIQEEQEKIKKILKTYNLKGRSKKKILYLIYRLGKKIPLDKKTPNFMHYIKKITGVIKTNNLSDTIPSTLDILSDIRNQKKDEAIRKNMEYFANPPEENKNSSLFNFYSVLAGYIFYYIFNAKNGFNLSETILRSVIEKEIEKTKEDVHKNSAISLFGNGFINIVMANLIYSWLNWGDEQDDKSIKYSCFLSAGIKFVSDIFEWRKNVKNFIEK